MGPATDARFAELYSNHSRRIFAYCRRRASTERAEDAVADVFLTAWRRIDDVPEGQEALLWLYGVAYRVLSHQRRSHSRHQKLEEKLEASGMTISDSVDFIVVLRDEAKRALQAVDRLRPKDAEMLRLAIWEELSHADIARVLGITTSAVAQRLHRAKKSLTREFQRLDKRTNTSPAAQEGGTW